MKDRYYQAYGTINEDVFAKRLAEIHNSVDGISDLNGLLSVRNKLYRLKRKYEECGQRYLECEYELLALNEIIEEERNRRGKQ